MTDFMTQQNFGLTAPVSRQDIVSALLNEYGNSFGHGDGSSSTLSPVPAEKELPPPPPQSGSLMNKPLPAVARAEKRMSMKFQLRGKRIIERHHGCMGRTHIKIWVMTSRTLARLYSPQALTFTCAASWDPQAHELLLYCAGPAKPTTEH